MSSLTSVKTSATGLGDSSFIGSEADSLGASSAEVTAPLVSSRAITFPTSTTSPSL